MVEVRPRVLVVTPRFYPEAGGIEAHVYEVTQRLQDRYAFTILTTDLTGELPAAEDVNGVRVERVPAHPRRTDWRVAPGIYLRVRDTQVDLVHCQGVHTFVPIFAMLAARQVGRRYLVTFHTGGHSSVARNRIRAAQWRALRPLLRRAERLVCVAAFERATFGAVLGLPTSRFEVIPNGGTLPSLPDEFAPEPGPVIVTVGRLERYKGHHRILRAMPDVLAEVPDARLVIVGRGPEEQALRWDARRLGVTGAVTITAVPPADRAGMARLLLGARVFALMSDYEAHPLAVMEALALGRPAVVAATAGLQELADQGLATAVAPEATPPDLARALVNQLRDPRPPPEVPAILWDECAERLDRVYSSLLGRRD